MPDAETEGDYAAKMAEHLLSFVNSTPLEIMAWACKEFGASPQTVGRVFDSYDAFLAILSDPDKRKRLEALHPEQAGTDPLFRESRDIGDHFQNGLLGLFFDSDERLRDAVHRYGVF